MRNTTNYRVSVRSQHPTHEWLRDNLPKFPFRAIVRLGSTTSTQQAYPRKTSEQIARIKQINTVQGVKNSSSKLLMKKCFTRAQVKTADWCVIRNNTWCGFEPNYKENMFDNDFRYWEYDGNLSDNCPFDFPIIAKALYGSRGTGNYKLDSKEHLEEWMSGLNMSNYIFEKFYNYSREYRLHVSKNGCFYTCRKMLKSDTPEENRWFRNDSNCNWILEDNELFDKPSNWDTIVDGCVKALESLGLDIAGFDVKVQSATKNNGEVRENPEFIVIESNSAPSFGLITGERYKNEIIKLLTQ